MTAHRPVRVGARALLAAAAAVLGIAIATAAAPRIGAHGKLFPEVVAGIAGVLVLGVAVVVLEPAWILSIGLGLSSFSGDWHYMHIPGPIDRLVTVVGIIAVVVRPWFVDGAPRIRARRLHWLLALLTLYSLGSAAWSDTLRQHAALFDLLDRLGIEPFLLFLVAPAAFATEHQRRILLTTMAVIGAYLGVIAIFEVIGPHSLVFPSFIMNPALGVHQGRARGPFLEAGADGLAMFNSAIACALLLGDSGRRRWRAALVAVIVLCVFGLLLTETRQVWAGAVAGAVVAALLSRRLRRLLPIGVLVVGLIVGGAYVSLPKLRAELNSRTSDQRSLWDRYNSDDAALRMIEERPLLGFGWGEFPTASPRYYHVARTYPLTSVVEVHNVTLSNAAELGLLGVVPWLIAVAIAMISPLTRRGPPERELWKLAAIAIAIAWFVQTNFAPVSYALDNYIPWVFAAIAYGAFGAEKRAMLQPSDDSGLFEAEEEPLSLRSAGRPTVSSPM